MARTREQQREYYRRNAQKIREKSTRWRIANPNKVSATLRNWEARNVIYRRNRQLKKYNLNVNSYQELFDRQSGVCKICLKPETSPRNKNLSVDHCHKTGIVRGLLCDKCNRTIGVFEDNLVLLKRAILYLEQYE